MGTNVGIQSMVTSVFGGLIVGLSCAGIYNKFKEMQLPAVIGFFNGVRGVMIVNFLAAILLGFMSVLL